MPCLRRLRRAPSPPRCAAPNRLSTGPSAIAWPATKTLSKSKRTTRPERSRSIKHFDLQITDHSFTFKRKTEQIATEAALDGIYILRTSLTTQECSTSDVVRSYKNLEQAERAFKTLKGPELQIRPIHHHLETRVRAHIFLCMLAYYLTWHLKRAWAPLIFKDEQPPTPSDPVASRRTGR
jgi:transposase